MAVSCDFLVVGGGVVGLTIALEVRRRYPSAEIVVIEKEQSLAAHASGRNSGVLHAGFYYTADSLKARFTRDGNRQWQAYCDAKGLSINRCGKLVVARDETEVGSLETLLERGRRNGVALEWLTESEARQIEPRVKTVEAALWSPDTAAISSSSAMQALADDVRAGGVRLQLGEAFCYHDTNSDHVVTSHAVYDAGYVVNAAGLYADRVADNYGFSRRHRIIPFKGLYLYAHPDAYHPATNIYPVPNPREPFLGVHYTRTVDGETKIGPTAIPAFWRENYRGFDNFRAGELAEIVQREIGLFTFNRFNFRRLALEELKKYSRRYMAGCAAAMLEGVGPASFTRWGKPGIRAQLMDIEKRALEMDFLVEGDRGSLHVLNAVSPAWTCAFPFARYIGDQIEGYRSK